MAIAYRLPQYILDTIKVANFGTYDKASPAKTFFI